MVDVPLIVTDRGLLDLVEHVRECGRFAFDTEFVSEETYEPILCLVQVATRDRLALIDSTLIRNLQPFWDVVNDPQIEVVMHAAGEDLRIGRLQSGTLPKRIVDVQVAAALVGHGHPLSLGNLIHQTLGISLSNSETRTDWRKRPLSPAQIHYAIDDVQYLLPLADQLQGRLETMHRSAWAKFEYGRLLDTIRSRDDEDRWRRLSGLHQLSRRGLEVARRLADWRRDEACRTNRPLRQVLRDDLLIAIAKRQPTSRRDLEALRDFNRPHLLQRAGDILMLVKDAQAVPPEELPEHAERFDEAPGMSMIVNLMAASLNFCSAREKVAASLVGTTSDLKELVRWVAAGEPDSPRPFLIQGWRGEVCGQTLIDVLKGRRTVRVVNLDTDVPVALESSESEKPSPTDIAAS